MGWVEKMGISEICFSRMRAGGARHIAAAGRFDLDHLGAQIGQVHRSEGAGAILLDRQDAHALQRQRLSDSRTHTGWRAINCLAMMVRRTSFVPSPMHINIASR